MYKVYFLVGLRVAYILNVPYFCWFFDIYDLKKTVLNVGKSSNNMYITQEMLLIDKITLANQFSRLKVSLCRAPGKYYN